MKFIKEELESGKNKYWFVLGLNELSFLHGLVLKFLQYCPNTIEFFKSQSRARNLERSMKEALEGQENNIEL